MLANDLSRRSERLDELCHSSIAKIGELRDKHAHALVVGRFELLAPRVREPRSLPLRPSVDEHPSAYDGNND
jgi:hypothetical protein